jgi:hypothetical protein
MVGGDSLGRGKNAIRQPGEWQKKKRLGIVTLENLRILEAFHRIEP